MSGDRLCYSCQTIVTDAHAAACTRKHCAARSDVERENKRTGGTRPPKANPGEYPNFSITYVPKDDDGAMN